MLCGTPSVLYVQCTAGIMVSHNACPFIPLSPSHAFVCPIWYDRTKTSTLLCSSIDPTSVLVGGHCFHKRWRIRKVMKMTELLWLQSVGSIYKRTGHHTHSELFWSQCTLKQLKLCSTSGVVDKEPLQVKREQTPSLKSGRLSEGWHHRYYCSTGNINYNSYWQNPTGSI